ncbi:hypothetical protein EJB05_48259 [Eragrostis curvula]|uniref:Uncharacterized protein n=1 Tax=Eragrostis curvula TaxID=38414 RepID=A0A5J9T2I6_9POAL|nr:hypothetical protein EJB05_48259 [Eragrostis curvula]
MSQGCDSTRDSLERGWCDPVEVTERMATQRVWPRMAWTRGDLHCAELGSTKNGFFLLILPSPYTSGLLSSDVTQGKEKDVGQKILSRSARKQITPR